MATFFNQATLSYSGGTVNSNITTGEIIEVLAATKTATLETYAPGSDITYAINLVNSGQTPLTGLTVTDDLGAYTFGTQTLRPLDYVTGSVTYFINGIEQATPTVTAEAPLTVTGLSIPAGGNALILYTARANEFAPPAADGTVDNTAVISGAGITDVTASETVTALAGPRLTITKSVSPTTVAENGEITYTFVIQNSGNEEADATDNVIVTDTFDPILSDITVTYNGATLTSPANYTYNEATGVFSTVAGTITVPAATYTQDPVSGAFVLQPGTAVLTVTGTV